MTLTGMHFAIFASGSCGGSLVSVSTYLASGIALWGHTVDVITLNTSEDDLRRFYRHVNGISLVNFYNLGVQHTRASIPALIKYYKSRMPDVIFSQLTHPSIPAIIAKFLSTAKVLNVFIEGTIVSKVGKVDAKSNVRLRLVPWLAKILYPYADGLIVKNNDILIDLKQLLGKRFEAIKIRILPNPYDLGRFRVLGREHVEHPWFVHKKIPVVLSVGRLGEAKGFDILVSAFARVISEVECRLIILGDGPERRRLERKIRELGLTDVVDMPGREDNPWKYMMQSALFVLSSRWEGWPSALMEAMICGLPVITTDCPGAGKEMVGDGARGLVVPMEDIDGLKRGISRLLKDSELRVNLSARAYQYSQAYDQKIVAQDYIAFAKSLLLPKA
jgi:glycosyltransferase involved in cell wall biosynthesis